MNVDNIVSSLNYLYGKRLRREEHNIWGNSCLARQQYTHLYPSEYFGINKKIAEREDIDKRLNNILCDLGFM